MNWSGKIITIIPGLGFITLIIGLNLLGTKYELVGLICSFIGALVFLPGLFFRFIFNKLKKLGGQEVKYGRYNDKT